MVVDPYIYCGKCYPCTHGKYNLCEELKVMGFQTTGTASEYFVCPAVKVTPLPEDMSYDEGAMIEPLAVAVHAVRKFGDVQGKDVCVLGAGTIGNLVAQVAKGLAREYDGKVLVVDDRRISVTLEQSVRNARTLLDQGMGPAQVRETLEAERRDCIVYLAVNTLEFLKKSGRVTAAAAAMAAVLHIKPILLIQEGKLDAYKKVRGMAHAQKALIEALRADLSTRFAGMKMKVFSGYSGGDPAVGRAWQKIVQAAFPEWDVGLISLPLSICCHTGEGALGVACVLEH